MKLRVTALAALVVGSLAALPVAAAQAATGCAAPGLSASTTVTTTTTTPTPTTTTATTTTGTTTTPVTTTPTTTTTVKTIPGKRRPPFKVRSATLGFAGLFALKGSEVTVPQRAVAVTLSVRPYVRDQRLTVTESLNGHVFRTVRLAARCTPGTDTGTLKLDVVAPGSGRVTVSASHGANRKLGAFRVRDSFSTLNTAVHPGSTGQFIELVQQRLRALHIYIPQTGVYDLGTELALDAYHRLLGWGEGIETLDAKTIDDLLNGTGSFHVRYPNQGQHAEGDLTLQVLAFIDGSKVQYIYPISSGKPSTPTILGEFQIYYKEPNYTPDGMYFSSFFHGGYAIHGYDPAPDYPASHGCMRLPMVDAIQAYSWTRVGDWVDTYYT